MPPHTYAKRVERLQELYAAKLRKPVAIKFLPFDAAHTAEDYDRVREELLDEMMADGDILPPQRQRVHFIRWQTRQEAGITAAAQAAAQMDGPLPEQAPEPEPTTVQAYPEPEKPQRLPGFDCALSFPDPNSIV